MCPHLLVSDGAPHNCTALRRVVITGLGMATCLGNDRASVAHALRNGSSGIRAVPEYAERGLRCHVAGTPCVDLEGRIDRRVRRFMGDAAAYAHVSMEDAMLDAGLTHESIVGPRMGVVAGSGGASSGNQVDAVDLLRAKGVRRIGPYMVTRTMCSSVSASLATSFRLQGLNLSISSACATSAHCIGVAMEQIQWGKQDLVFAGGGEELHWAQTMMFDAMGALSTRHNATPDQASRPYDAHRDGLVIAGGGGMVVLESLEHAQARGARILAELVGYGATSDGGDMVAPSVDGAARCMRQALGTVDRPVDYVNTHGTSTPRGDLAELDAMRLVFGERMPPFSSTKSLSGHALGAAGVMEVIFCLLMMDHGFMAGSANITQLDEGVVGLPLVRAARHAVLNTVMTNSFGFGGTNAVLVLQRWVEAS